MGVPSPLSSKCPTYSTGSQIHDKPNAPIRPPTKLNPKGDLALARQPNAYLHPLFDVERQ